MDTDVQNLEAQRGHRIQRYSADGRLLLTTYANPHDVAVDLQLALDRPHALKIAEAVIIRRLYKGFRWAYLPTAIPSETVQDIGNTVSTLKSCTDFVAALDEEGTLIDYVYASVAAAARECNVDISAVALSMSNGTITGGNRFVMLKDCTPEMCSAFEALRGPAEMPHKPTRTSGRAVQKLRADGSVAVRYACVGDAMVTCKLSRHVIHVAIASQNAIQDATGGSYKWRYESSYVSKYPKPTP